MPQPDKDSTTAVDLERDEVAVILRDEGGVLAARIAVTADPAEGGELSTVHEVAVALAMRLMKDPDFQDDVLDWYYEHQDEPEEDEEEE